LSAWKLVFSRESSVSYAEFPHGFRLRRAGKPHQTVPPTVIFSMRSVGWPTPTGTL
jgi:hypothetical protein